MRNAIYGILQVRNYHLFINHLKNQKTMKKLSTLLIAAVLVFGMTQCKKNVETAATPNNIGEPVHITLNVGGGDRHDVFTNTGAVVYTDGDVIYVGNNGKYIGYLTYDNGAFSGDIYSPSAADYLHFYFVGGLTPSTTPVANSTENFTVNIADQSSKLPVLSYNHSTQKYTDGNATYGCTLLNKCGLVKFVTGTPTSNTVFVGGMKTQATISFATPGITPTDATGVVALYAESDAAKWAILLVQDEVSTPTVTIAGYTSTITSVPAVTENIYYTNGGNGVSISMTPFTPEFSVSSTKTVQFAPGNLQYKDGTGWRFAPNQWDIIGSWNTSDWVDLFGWGTWGDEKNPLNTSDENADYEWNTDFTGELDGHNDWYTLSSDEWRDLFFNRTDAANKVGNATVCGNYGIIILPDSFTDPMTNKGSYAFAPIVTDGWDVNVYTAGVNWGAMEAAGAVFLPATGFRSGTDMYFVGSWGTYWSSSDCNYQTASYAEFDGSKLDVDAGPRGDGLPVRLVR